VIGDLEGRLRRVVRLPRLGVAQLGDEGRHVVAAALVVALGTLSTAAQDSSARALPTAVRSSVLVSSRRTMDSLA
jgi:hypothetical protein